MVNLEILVNLAILVNLVILVNLAILLDLEILESLCENMILSILESPPFQKYSICWVNNWIFLTGSENTFVIIYVLLTQKITLRCILCVLDINFCWWAFPSFWKYGQP